MDGIKLKIIFLEKDNIEGNEEKGGKIEEKEQRKKWF